MFSPKEARDEFYRSISSAIFVLRVAPDGQDAAVRSFRQSVASRINNHCDRKVDRIRYGVLGRISERPVDVRV